METPVSKYEKLSIRRQRDVHIKKDKKNSQRTQKKENIIQFSDNVLKRCKKKHQQNVSEYYQFIFPPKLSSILDSIKYGRKRFLFHFNKEYSGNSNYLQEKRLSFSLWKNLVYYNYRKGAIFLFLQLWKGHHFLQFQKKFHQTQL